MSSVVVVAAFRAPSAVASLDENIKGKDRVRFGLARKCCSAAEESAAVLSVLGDS